MQIDGVVKWGKKHFSWEFSLVTNTHTQTAVCVCFGVGWMKWTAADDDRDGLFIFGLSGSSSYLNDRPADTHRKKGIERFEYSRGWKNLYLDKHGIANESAINRPASFFFFLVFVLCWFFTRNLWWRTISKYLCRSYSFRWSKQNSLSKCCIWLRCRTTPDNNNTRAQCECVCTGSTKQIGGTTTSCTHRK